MWSRARRPIGIWCPSSRHWRVCRPRRGRSRERAATRAASATSSWERALCWPASRPAADSRQSRWRQRRLLSAAADADVVVDWLFSVLWECGRSLLARLCWAAKRRRSSRTGPCPRWPARARRSHHRPSHHRGQSGYSRSPASASPCSCSRCCCYTCCSCWWRRWPRSAGSLTLTRQHRGCCPTWNVWCCCCCCCCWMAWLMWMWMVMSESGRSSNWWLSNSAQVECPVCAVVWLIGDCVVWAFLMMMMIEDARWKEKKKKKKKRLSKLARMNKRKTTSIFVIVVALLHSKAANLATNLPCDNQQEQQTQYE